MRLWKGCVLWYGMDHVVLISVNWDVFWFPAGWWDDKRMCISPPGANQETSWLRLDDSKNSEEL